MIASAGRRRVLLFCSLLILLANKAAAGPMDAHGVLNISGDRGGALIDYAIRAMKAKQSQKLIRISGSCASACTLYLTVPKDRLCITRRAAFRFHLPYGKSAKSNRAAAAYLMQNYPDWVKAWLAVNGGLTSDLKTMDYAFARRHLRTCVTG